MMCMNDGATKQLSLFALSALDYSASLVVQGIAEKVEQDERMGLLGGEDYEADFSDDGAY
jgi:hypothetical protein